jgi:phosphoglycolate phosphatase-like HAD superfamily hydrolase
VNVEIAMIDPSRHRIVLAATARAHGVRAWCGILLIALASAAPAWAQPLASWNDTAPKQAIVQFVTDVTTPGAPTFVPADERIAVFDNDGTLWAEQPIYFQAAFLIDQVHALAPKHPEWKKDPAFKALMARDTQALAAMGPKPVMRILAQANTGMSTSAYETSLRDWFARAKHPKSGRPYTEMAYVPMLELLQYLRGNGFKTFIVSGGGIEFMRVIAQGVYGIPPEQVIGSIIDVSWKVVDGKPALIRRPRIDFVDDGPGKPVGIYRAIGRPPIFAFQ